MKGTARQHGAHAHLRQGGWYFQLLFIGGVFGFVLLALAAHQAPYFWFDRPVTQAVQSVRADWVEPTARAISWPGFPPQSSVLFGAVVASFLVFKRWLEAAAVAASAIGSGGLYLLAQQLVGQPRPSGELVLVAQQLALSAFPSGHEASFTAVFGFVVFIIYTSARSQTVRWLPLVLLSLALSAVGWSRIYEGAHWISDVFGGVFLGCLWLAVVIRSYRSIHYKLGTHRAPSVERASALDELLS